MATSIGEKLRLARETRGIALHDISEQTRISMRYLVAIEADDYRRLPGGIFNRSFIRAYAKQIGYDEQEAVEEYSTMMHERGESTDEAKPARSLVYTEEGSSRSPLTTILLAVIILAVLSLCVWAAWYFYEHKVKGRTQTPSPARQRLVMDRQLITIQNAIAAAQFPVMELRHAKEDANDPVA